MGVTVKTQTGFTIIEVMLFLAVSGALAAIILVGSGVAIGQQRYRDSVSSLKSYIQQQYSEVTNVANDRDKDWTCNNEADVSQVDASAGEARGTSDCVILGRFVTIDETGTKLTAANVIGLRNPGAPDQPSDILELKNNYKLSISPVVADDSEVSWGSRVTKPKTNTPMPVSLLILRSPLSGSIVTFTAEGLQTNLSSMIAAGNMAQKDMCVSAESGSFVGHHLAVRVDAFATSQSAIQVPAESENICD